MAKNVNKRKSSVTLGEAMLGLAGVMFCLVLITTSMIGGMFAKYSASGTGSDEARVAGFDVKVTGQDNVTCEVTALQPGEFNLTVENDSEVAVSYSIRVEIYENAGCGVRVILDNDNTKKLEFPANKNNTLEYPGVGSLAVGAEAATHTLTFEPLDWTKITKEATGESELLTQNFTIYVDVVQID